MKKSRWGILGTAGIARKQLIPSLQSSDMCEVVAVASRDIEKAKQFAQDTHIAHYYGSYEALLEDPSIDIIYIPLPNHLHVEYIKKAVSYGKHVLCEKPIALSVADVEELIALRNSSGLMIGEAYAMYYQPRLQEIKKLLTSGSIGEPLVGHGVFFLTNNDKDNIRNAYTVGGGALWDIGVYPIAVGRWLFGAEPVEVSCEIENDKDFNVDHFTSGLLKFPSGGRLSFSCGMKHPSHTHMSFSTQTHRIEIEKTYHSDYPHSQFFEIFTGDYPSKGKKVSFDPVDQYRLECEAFHNSIFNNEPFAGSLENSLSQTKTIVALFKAASSKKVERV
ncbi:MAG: Gfo/Idh/MocA family oxidoreductase [Spirochaetia bacterium]|nr:Gfo/Idh/MocA family oxidoreductase [Spirochaetia bacterium]